MGIWKCLWFQIDRFVVIRYNSGNIIKERFFFLPLDVSINLIVVS